MRWINRQPGRAASLALTLMPFVLLAIIYVVASDARLAENANDKLLPSLSTFGETMSRMMFEPDKRNGELLFWGDTLSSLVRLFLGLIVAGVLGLAVGVINGMLPYARSSFGTFVRVLSMIPPMAILPILFIVFGLGELSKVVLIVIGVAPFLMRDMQQRVQEIPSELITKAQTLSANSWQILLRVVLPQVLPRLLAGLRLSLGPAWLFLIAAEAIASTDGLGYRIFLVRRYLSMDVILPYVAWITFLAYVMDVGLRQLSRLCFPWFHTNPEADA
ncbi:MAG: ABC transporter permease [Alcanivoracaceae bacterium]|nr:ABC transporter permease [Alcanivoracaceae bacterium]